MSSEILNIPTAKKNLNDAPRLRFLTYYVKKGQYSMDLQKVSLPEQRKKKVSLRTFDFNSTQKRKSPTN